MEAVTQGRKSVSKIFSTACARIDVLRNTCSKPIPQDSLSQPKCWMHPLPAIVVATAKEQKAMKKFRACNPVQNQTPTSNSQLHIPTLCCCCLCFSSSFLVGSTTLHFAHLYFFLCVLMCFLKACLSMVEYLHLLQCSLR